MEGKKIREEVVSGMFYPGEEKRLRKQLDQYINPNQVKKKVFGLISPHAGYIYSGSCAGKVFSEVQITDTVVVLGVAHNPSYCPEFGIESADLWQTPLGNLQLDRELAEKLVNRNGQMFAFAAGINSNEHSIEVQLPFLKYLHPDVKIVPILISSFNKKSIIEAGGILAETLKEEEPVLMVASTDMSHYISAEEAKKKDQLVIDRIEAMDPEGLLDAVYSERISMCGSAPSALMISAARELGATAGKLVEYTHSGFVSGDYNQVVGYAGFIIN